MFYSQRTTLCGGTVLWVCPTTPVKKNYIFGLVGSRAKRMPILVEIGRLLGNFDEKKLSPTSRSSENLQYATVNNS